MFAVHNNRREGYFKNYEEIIIFSNGMEAAVLHVIDTCIQAVLVWIYFEVTKSFCYYF